MIKWLPTDAAVWRSNGSSWSIDNELNATTIEIIDALFRAFIQANSKPNSKKPKPIKIPRPYDNIENTHKRRTTIKELLNNGIKIKK